MAVPTNGKTSAEKGLARGAQATASPQDAAAGAQASVAPPQSSQPPAPGQQAAASPRGGPAPAPANAKAVAPSPTSPPKPGTYKYRTTMSGKDREGNPRNSTSESTRRVESLGESGGDLRQAHVVKEGPSDTKYQYIWRKDVVLVTGFTSAYGETTSECDLNPDLPELKLPLSKGAEWSYDSSCEFVGPTGPVKLRLAGKTKIVDVARVTIGGVAVDTYVSESANNVTYSTTQGSQTTTFNDKSHFSPQHGLQVKTSSTGENFTREIELLSLTPS